MSDDKFEVIVQCTHHERIYSNGRARPVTLKCRLVLDKETDNIEIHVYDDLAKSWCMEWHEGQKERSECAEAVLCKAARMLHERNQMR